MSSIELAAPGGHFSGSEDLIHKITRLFGLVDPQKRSLLSREFWQYADSYRADVQEIESRFGVNIRAGKATEQADWREHIKVSPLALPTATQAARITREELTKYPPEFIRECALRNLFLVSAVATLNDNRNWGGLACEDGNTYIVHYPRDPNYTRNTVHHEIWHESDSSNNRHFKFKRIIKDLVSSAEWSSGGPYLGDSYNTKRYNDCFACDYGQRNKHEDRATTAALLMVDPEAAFSHAERNNVFNHKLSQIIDEYRERSHGRMDRRFFEDLLVGKVGPDYWENR